MLDRLLLTPAVPREKFRVKTEWCKMSAQKRNKTSIGKNLNKVAVVRPVRCLRARARAWGRKAKRVDDGRHLDIKESAECGEVGFLQCTHETSLIPTNSNENPPRGRYLKSALVTFLHGSKEVGDMSRISKTCHRRQLNK